MVLQGKFSEFVRIMKLSHTKLGGIKVLIEWKPMKIPDFKGKVPIRIHYFASMTDKWQNKNSIQYTRNSACRFEFDELIIDLLPRHVNHEFIAPVYGYSDKLDNRMNIHDCVLIPPI
jgi:hypothetical protein